MIRRRVAAGAAVLVLAGAVGHARDASAAGSAEERKECSTAAEKAQRLRNDGKLKDAREQLVICARNACPAVVRRDCEPWLSELETRLPSVVIVAKDAHGKDVVDVRVAIDGAQVTDHLDGKAISVDPGVHTFRYERQGSPAVDDKLVIREGERGRVVDVSFESPNDTRGGDADKGRKGEGGRTETTTGSPVGAVVVGALGLAAIGSFAYFHLSAKSDIDDMRSTCAPRCDQSRVDDANTKIIISDVSLGAGVVALGIATWLFIARPTKVVEVRSSRVGVHFTF